MRSITVNASRTYDIHIGSGLLSRVGELAAPLLKGREAVIVSDSNVFPLYGQTVISSLEEAGFHIVPFVFLKILLLIVLVLFLLLPFVHSYLLTLILLNLLYLLLK